MTDKGEISRRTFLEATAAASGLAVLASSKAEAEVMQTQRVRRSFNSLDMSVPADKKIVDQYAEGVRVMVARSASNTSDIKGWNVQAGLHTYRCQHGNWWFFPWHRAYLYYFEKLIQDAVSDPSFALPYWDWTDNSQLSLPSAFINPSSSLYDPRRIANANAGAPVLDWSFYNYYYGGVLNYVLGRPNFVPSFGSSAAGTFPGLERSHGTEYPHGDVEGGPHDTVHGSVGGSGQPDMGNPTYSALDPIFWLHHCNIDRLWSRWRAADPTNHTNPGDAVWHNQQFEFVDSDGTLKLMAVNQVLSTWDSPLNYRYDDEAVAPTAVAVAPALVLIPENHAMQAPGHAAMKIAGEVRHELVEKPTALSLKLNAHAEKVVAPAVANVPAPRVFLLIEGIQFEGKASGTVEVYLNAPELEAGKRPDKIYAVGTFSIFAGHAPAPMPGMDQAMHPATPPSFDRIFDITDNVQALEKAGKWNKDTVQVQLVRQPFVGDTKPVGSVTFARALIQIKGVD